MIYTSKDNYWLISKLHIQGFSNIELIVPNRNESRTYGGWVFVCDEINRDIFLGYTKKEVVLNFNRKMKEINDLQKNDY